MAHWGLSDVAHVPVTSTEQDFPEIILQADTGYNVVSTSTVRPFIVRVRHCRVDWDQAPI